MYEIDPTIQVYPSIPKEQIIYGDFLSQKITKKYVTIVGNPPYVRTSKGNLYIDFISKCFQLLDDHGELIFIVPSDLFKLTCAAKLLTQMMNEGTFTHIFHPHNEKMFDGASVDVIVFRYLKDKDAEKKALYNDVLHHISCRNGFITFHEGEEKKGGEGEKIFEEYFDIYVGLVSGKEEVYKHETLGNIDVLNGFQKVEKYIFLESFPSQESQETQNTEDINTYLLQYKEALLQRKIRTFHESNWFEWGAPRNISSIRKRAGTPCIYLYNLTRKKQVAFLGEVMYFGGNLLMLVPKEEFKEKVDLEKVMEYLNNTDFQKQFISAGRFKIGHRQISYCVLPQEYYL
jgi:adenine-specific DNA-methyltransferase